VGAQASGRDRVQHHCTLSIPQLRHGLECISFGEHCQRGYQRRGPFLPSLRHFVALFLFSLSILVTSGTHLALHIYSGHNGGELIDELYRFQYDTSYLVLPVFNTDFAAALKALGIAAFGFDMPELDWGPENFKELSRDLQTCTVLLAFLKSAIALLGYVLAAGKIMSPSVFIAAAASGKKLEREGREEDGEEDKGKRGKKEGSVEGSVEVVEHGDIEGELGGHTVRTRSL
jgi:hypothetical protein